VAGDDSDADGVVVEFRDDGQLVVGRTSPVSVPAGVSVPVSLTWDTHGVNGDRVVAAVVDPDDAIVESDEDNNIVSRTVTIRGNKVTNGSFETSSDDNSPDGWTGSGSTSYDTCGPHAHEGTGAVGVRSAGATDRFGEPFTAHRSNNTPDPCLTTEDRASEGVSFQPSIVVQFSAVADTRGWTQWFAALYTRESSGVRSPRLWV
jgi:hypothetical protein